MTFAAQVQKAACGLGKAEVPSSILGSGSSSVGRRPRLPGGYSGSRNTGQPSPQSASGSAPDS